MKKFLAVQIVVIFIVITTLTVSGSTKNEADTELRETLKYALISSLSTPVDKAINKIYKDDKHVPEHLTWAAYDTEMLKIRQVYGVGGLYEVTLKVFPYYAAHNYYGEDEVMVNTNGELISYKHLKTYR